MQKLIKENDELNGKILQYRNILFHIDSVYLTASKKAEKVRFYLEKTRSLLEYYLKEHDILPGKLPKLYCSTSSYNEVFADVLRQRIRFSRKFKTGEIYFLCNDGGFDIIVQDVGREYGVYFCKKWLKKHSITVPLDMETEQEVVYYLKRVKATQDLSFLLPTKC
jgi:hypothetical protein